MCPPASDIRRIVITGATEGIGKETAKQLAGRHVHLWLVARNANKAAQTVAEVQSQAADCQVRTVLADLSRPRDVIALARTLAGEMPHLDVLINNAGAVFARRTLTSDGLEMTFALNHLSYFLLAVELLPLLQAAPSARIVNVASEAHRGRPFNFDDIHAERRYSGWSAYQQSKLANVLFTRELARRLAGDRVTVNALHPGFVASRFGHDNPGWLPRVTAAMQSLFAISPAEGARTSVFLARSPETIGISGRYFAKCHERQPSIHARDDAAARRLFEYSETLASRFRS